ncbi:hypothetical protein P0082_11900 [Candidatus Haliotispira prima]|uniref:Uncharacterized protein n=1 Tax=Candidatus Haliotispira prima TaxID=3034016 RepID=A0ABY8MH01_9SPIO|nr:hypothetical protein P0082_11900 [Candidatus Haliotispira prima]
MNIKQKRLLFLLSATLVNLVITIACFAVLLLLTLRFLDGYLEIYGGTLLLIPLVVSVAVSFFSYRTLLRWADRKWQINRHLD